MKIPIVASAGLVLILAAGTAIAGDGLTEIDPFTGQKRETFEGFQNYNDNPNFNMDEPSVIFGGNTEISGNGAMVIYDPAAAGYGLGSSGAAQVFDGTQGWGYNTNTGTVTINFLNNDVVDFGAYFGLATDGGGAGDPGVLFLEFYNADDDLFASTSFEYSASDTGDGHLEWHGWHANQAISRIELTGIFWVMDGMQKNIPTPGALALLGLAGLAARRRRRA